MIATADADLETAKINLGYTDIVSPISGKISRTNMTKGNVVGPDRGTLTTIVSQDPMYVTFPVSQRDFLRAQKSGHPVDLASIKVKLRFSDGSSYDQLGTAGLSGGEQVIVDGLQSIRPGTPVLAAPMPQAAVGN